MVISSNREVSVKVWIAVVVASMAFVGCNEEPEGVESQVSRSGDEVQCPTADAQSTFDNGSSIKCETYSCRWFCVEYEGKSDQYVDRQYGRCGNEAWRFAKEYVRDADPKDCTTE